MYTQCPQCETWFRVGAQQLRAAHGRVRCSACRATFDALVRLADEPAKSASAGVDEAPPPVAEVPTAEIGAGGSEMLAEPRDTHVPRSGRVATAVWATLSVLAAVGLVAQTVYWNFDRWAQDTRIRPWMQAVCERVPAALPVDCRLPPLVALDKLELQSYEFTSHPGLDDALYFGGVLVNHADLPQAYPLLYISMQNRWGETVAVGHFGPADYLTEPVRADKGIPANGQVPIRLALRDPGREATGFRFDFEARN